MKNYYYAIFTKKRECLIYLKDCTLPSGLSLDRPLLNQLRDMVRSNAIDIIVVYSLDRWTRDPNQGVILSEELDKYNVHLESVTEDIQTSELGKLISYIRGFASKLEAEKIKERTMRGKKAHAKSGDMQSGGFGLIYGYDYIPRIDSKTPPRRVINESESKVIKQIFSWIVDDHLSCLKIVKKLRDSNIPTKRNGLWCAAAVRYILHNESYYGKTIAYQKTDRIDIPGVTPAIITPEVYEAAQLQIKANKFESKRNLKREYLLRSLLRCRQCDHAFYGRTGFDRKGGKRIIDRRYCCSGRLQHVSADCHNPSWLADDLENKVWNKIKEIIKKPEIIFNEFDKKQSEVKSLDIYRDDLKTIERKLKTLDNDQKRLLQLALKDFPESMVQVENKKINSQRKDLQDKKAKLEAKIEDIKTNTINLDKIKQLLAIVQDKIDNATYRQKRLILEALNITVWVDNKKAYITGSIGEDIVIEDNHSRLFI